MHWPFSFHLIQAAYSHISSVLASTSFYSLFHDTQGLAVRSPVFCAVSDSGVNEGKVCHVFALSCASELDQLKAVFTPVPMLGTEIPPICPNGLATKGDKLQEWGRECSMKDTTYLLSFPHGVSGTQWPSAGKGCWFHSSRDLTWSTGHVKRLVLKILVIDINLSRTEDELVWFWPHKCF